VTTREIDVVNLSKLAQKAKGLADQHGDKIAAAVDKATNVANEKTKGKYADKLAKVEEAAKKLDKRNPGGPPAAAEDPGNPSPS
jgi:hypothetical protein